jgi:hypothetical protein
MSSHVVKSPTGAEIEIVSDDDWALTAGVGIRSLAMWARSKPLVIRELWEHGPVTDKSGRATAVLLERIREHYPDTVYELSAGTGVHALLSDATNAAAFHRRVQGKRTYEIKLIALPEIWYEKLRWDIGTRGGMYTATPVTNGTKPDPVEVFIPSESDRQAAETVATLVLPEELPPLDIVEESPAMPEPVLDIDISRQVAMDMLTLCVEIIAAGKSDGVNVAELQKLRNELVHSQGLLSERLGENDRLRKQVRDLGEELRSTKFERDGLRQRLRATETNLSAALKGETAHAVTTEVMKRVDRIMREPPKPNRAGEL